MNNDDVNNIEDGLNKMKDSMDKLARATSIMGKLKGGTEMVQLAELLEAKILIAKDKAMDREYAPKTKALEVLITHGLDVTDALREVGIFMRRQGSDELLAESKANRMDKNMADFLKEMNDKWEQ